MLIRNAVAALALAATLTAAPAAVANSGADLMTTTCALTIHQEMLRGCWRPQTTPTKRTGADQDNGVDYYVSLGDSFSVGVAADR